MGFYLIVFTGEEDAQKVGEFLSNHNIPYNSINENFDMAILEIFLQR